MEDKQKENPASKYGGAEKEKMLLSIAQQEFQLENERKKGFEQKASWYLTFVAAILVIFFNGNTELLRKCIGIIHCTSTSFWEGFVSVLIIVFFSLAMLFLFFATREILSLVGLLKEYKHIDLYMLGKKIGVARSDEHYILFLGEVYEEVIEKNRRLNDRKANQLSEATTWLSYAIYSIISWYVACIVSGF